MGYTHYYGIKNWDTAEWQIAWQQLIQDVPIILEAADVLICGPRQGDEDLELPIVHVEEGIYFNGVADDGHEDFRLLRDTQNAFVKTLQKPYDVPVACVLLRAYLLAPKHFNIGSDGSWNQIEWVRARQLYQDLWMGEPICCPWGEMDDDKKIHPLSNDGPDTKCLPVTIQSNSSSSLQCGINISTVSSIDYTQIRQWLTQCERDVGHTECKASPTRWQKIPGVSFRVIDLHRRCIVEAPDDCSFVALTYVWGRLNQPTLNTATAPFLMQDGGLDMTYLKVPTTIRDAFFVCEQLGERYLWVDALCLMQDSTRDMKIQISRMRQIYSSAKCTIAAVSAETAEGGLLAGQTAENLKILTDCKSDDFLNNLFEASPWSSRAWCYQEKVLSHRLILFTSDGIYLQCLKGTYNAQGAELSGKEKQSSSKFNAVGGMLSVSPGEDLESYISAVEYYSRRKLSKQEDKMNAFQGIFRRYRGKMDGQQSSFCYGLPIFAFDQTICWRSHQHNPHLRSRVYPSWSWLGWSEAVSFDRNMLQTARTDQMIHGSDDYLLGVKYTSNLRKPASWYMPDAKFGFPAGTTQFYNTPRRHLCASVANLSIAMDPIDSNGSNCLYAVFSFTGCDSIKPPISPLPQAISSLDISQRQISKIERPDLETGTRSSLFATEKTNSDYGCTEHDNCEISEASTRLGYIWLDKKWRDDQPDQCVMQFMALAGKKDPNRQGEWIITMLMCLQRMQNTRFFMGHERVQVMDCEIHEKMWLKIGAKIITLVLI